MTLLQDINDNGGFLTSDQINEMSASDPFRQLLVRCGSGRFTCPSQDVRHFSRLVRWSGNDYVRDVSLPAQAIYRVTVKETNSLQPCGTFWSRRVLYCGTNRVEARVKYHESSPDDGGHGNFGNSCRTTLVEVITDANDKFAKDEVKRATYDMQA